jgi:hypothetical protein
MHGGKYRRKLGTFGVSNKGGAVEARIFGSDSDNEDSFS